MWDYIEKKLEIVLQTQLNKHIMNWTLDMLITELIKSP